LPFILPAETGDAAAANKMLEIVRKIAIAFIMGLLLCSEKATQEFSSAWSKAAQQQLCGSRMKATAFLFAPYVKRFMCPDAT
jgi:hypothetical protein